MNTLTELSYALRVTLNEQVDMDKAYVEYDLLVKKICKWVKPIRQCFAFEIGKKAKRKHLQGYVVLKEIKKKSAISNWFIRHFYKNQYSFSSCRECEFNNLVYVCKDNMNCKNKLAIVVKDIDIGDLIRYKGFTEEQIKEAIRTSRINHNNWKLSQKLNKMKTKYNRYLYLCRKQAEQLVNYDSSSYKRAPLRGMHITRQCIHKVIYDDCMKNNKMLPASFQYRNYIDTIFHQLNHKKHYEECLKQSYNEMFPQD